MPGLYHRTRHPEVQMGVGIGSKPVREILKQASLEAEWVSFLLL